MNWYRPQPVRRQPADHIGTRAMAAVLGLGQERVRQLLKAGVIRGVRLQMPEALRNFADERPRRTGLGDWRVSLADWEAFLRAYRARAGSR